MSYVRSMYDLCPGGETRNLFNDHNREKPIANVLGLHIHQIRPFADIHRPRTRSGIFALIVSEKHVYAFFFPPVRGVFRILSNICDEIFLGKGFVEILLDK